MKRALIIEDDPDVASSLVDLLSLEGCAVDSTESGAEGEILAEKNQYDVIIIDWGLPDKQGKDRKSVV